MFFLLGFPKYTSRHCQLVFVSEELACTPVKMAAITVCVPGTHAQRNPCYNVGGAGGGGVRGASSRGGNSRWLC